VTQRRIDYVAAQLVECGFRPGEAERRAVLAYAAYVGWWQLRVIAPARIPKGRRAAKHAEILRELLKPPLPADHAVAAFATSEDGR
jgi:hypothetical protein